ncbi:MAG: MBL fold metallo-hydrolase [Candidatus Neomarinimicrobiota bacterium]
MKIKFWGVRGSIPSPGSATLRYGGNTSCTSVHLKGDRTLVLDAGTGIRNLGKALLADTTDIYILISHNHWDHIQGFPFFAPLYQPDRTVFVFQTPYEKRRLCALVDQMDGAHFPVKADELPSDYQCVEEEMLTFLAAHGFNIARIDTNHPGGGFGYRVEENGRSMVYLTDNELEPPYPRATGFEEFVRFCQGSDVLIHDAQYREDDMPHKHGWGHSLVSQVCELARAAEVQNLILYHHDPDRSDTELDAIQEEANSRLQKMGQNIRCTVAYEGLEVEL